MVGFNKTKSELGTLQDALARTQIDLEKANFELHAKTSRLSGILIIQSSLPLPSNVAVSLQEQGLHHMMTTGGTSTAAIGFQRGVVTKHQRL